MGIMELLGRRTMPPAALLLLALGWVMGCAPRHRAAPASGGSEGGVVTTRRFEGELTREGVECQAMRGTDGLFYTLVDVPEEFAGPFFEAGVKVWVVGEIVPASKCMQGTTIAVWEMGRR
jgi:hypothetical protein